MGGGGYRKTWLVGPCIYFFFPSGSRPSRWGVSRWEARSNPLVWGAVSRGDPKLHVVQSMSWRESEGVVLPPRHLNPRRRRRGEGVPIVEGKERSRDLNPNFDPTTCALCPAAISASRTMRCRSNTNTRNLHVHCRVLELDTGSFRRFARQSLFHFTYIFFWYW